jgi:GNAT superfamily N-acetyltransferase
MACYEAAAAEPSLHAAAIVDLDLEWVAEGIAPFRGCALTERDVYELSARDDVLLLVLLYHADGDDEASEHAVVGAGVHVCAPRSAVVVGFAWADIQPDERDILLDTRPCRLMCDLHFVFVTQQHRGRGHAGRTLYAAVESIAVERSCTHIELIADSIHSEQLLRFYSQVCGMSYMFTRLRKELTEPPKDFPPLPIPYANAAGGQAATVMQHRPDANEDLVAQLRQTIVVIKQDYKSAQRNLSEAAAVEQQLRGQIAELQHQLRAADDTYAETSRRFSEALVVSSSCAHSSGLSESGRARQETETVQRRLDALLESQDTTAVTGLDWRDPRSFAMRDAASASELGHASSAVHASAPASDIAVTTTAKGGATVWVSVTGVRHDDEKTSAI